MASPPSLSKTFSIAAESALTLYKALSSSLTAATRSSTEELADFAHDVLLSRVTMVGLHERIGHLEGRTEEQGAMHTDSVIVIVKGLLEEVHSPFFSYFQLMAYGLHRLQSIRPSR